MLVRDWRSECGSGIQRQVHHPIQRCHDQHQQDGSAQYKSVIDLVNFSWQLIDCLDMAAAYASSEDEDQQLINNLALFLCNFLSTHLRLIETPDNTELLINAHLYLIKISTVDDREIFKICLEYWAKVSIFGRCENMANDLSSLLPSFTRRSNSYHLAISTL
jgi:hypothetical protein